MVIAILGILAAIAIPRFSGFTERAKERADEQYAALVANSVMVLVAAGDFNYSAGADLTVNISPNGSIVSIAADPVAGFGYKTGEDITDLQTKVLALVQTSDLTSTIYASGISVEFSDAGDKAFTAAVVANP